MARKKISFTVHFRYKIIVSAIRVSVRVSVCVSDGISLMRTKLVTKMYLRIDFLGYYCPKVVLRHVHASD